MQSLYVGDNKWILIDRTFVDNGLPAKMGVSGGHVVEMAPPIPARPTVMMANGGFYYTSRDPVTDVEHVGHLPKHFREQAEKWIKAQAGKAKPLRVTIGKATDDGHPVPPDRGTPVRGTPRVIDSEEKAERELVGGGIREVDAAESRRQL